MLVIGITGGIGSGKTSVAAILEEAGLKVINADRVAHDVTGKDGAAVLELASAFGAEYIKDGALDRKMMASLVFGDKNALDLLNSIVHKHVLLQMAEELDLLAEKKEKVAILDVPLPVKHGFLDRCDLVFSVWTDDEIRLARLKARGLSEAEARQRMAVQMKREEYLEIADGEILNNGSLADLRLEIEKHVGRALKERGIRYKDIIKEDERSEIEAK